MLRLRISDAWHGVFVMIWKYSSLETALALSAFHGIWFCFFGVYGDGSRGLDCGQKGLLGRTTHLVLLVVLG